MSRSLTRRTTAVAALSGAMVLAPLGVAMADSAPQSGTGPSTKTAPYVLPVAKDVSITSLLTVGDAPDGYPMVGIPDGLGAFGRGEGPFTIFMNHELQPPAGAVRAHGQVGAFVSKWTIDPKSGAVSGGSDLITSVNYWNYPAKTYGSAPVAPAGAAAGHTAAFSRFCSGALTEPGQLLNRKSGKGYDGQIYMANEESGDEGRVFGVTTDGVAWQLPALGLFSWENTLVAPTRGDATVVLGNEDANPGQLRVYVGTKGSSGSAVEKAGLTNGTSFVIDDTNPAVTNDAQYRAAYGKGADVPVVLNAINTTVNGKAQNAEALGKGISLNRIEDGSFDPKNPNDYYFLTTEGGNTAPVTPGVSRDGGGLWLLRFSDVNQPSLGATLTLLLDGSEAPFLSKPDNMTIDREGNIVIQEDPGDNAHVARIVAYRIEDGALATLAQFDPAQFTPGAPGFITQDEESSGIIEISKLADQGSTFLFDAQVHKKLADPALVEMGQLLTLTVASWGDVYDQSSSEEHDNH
ncbi:MAG: alkaline phosphatase PhoX [Actinomycetes bacterium]